jgi:integrase
MESLDVPDVPIARRDVYTPEEFERLLQHAEFSRRGVLQFVALSGFAFFRTRELVNMYENEPTLQWEHILWEQNRIHVPEEVAKCTRRRSGNERFVPINDSLGRILSMRKRKAAGKVCPFGQSLLTVELGKLFKIAKVRRIPNGLRKSAISYWLAANPENGVGEVAKWAGNSEAASRAHYYKLLTPEQGRAWFAVKLSLEA